MTSSEPTTMDNLATMALRRLAHSEDSAKPTKATCRRERHVLESRALALRLTLKSAKGPAPRGV